MQIALTEKVLAASQRPEWPDADEPVDGASLGGRVDQAERRGSGDAARQKQHLVEVVRRVIVVPDPVVLDAEQAAKSATAGRQRG